ncbi:MAG: response regulator transcription factor [Bacteroidetes bacterium]|nr:response regulator transcription factor [Bacteroidota bacterium]MBU1680882.1 response regulator transcription factor [Bacteroidota bacterium]MBU2507694.1 response regulator transcription factor [Bacteroidota bacterium]
MKKSSVLIVEDHVLISDTLKTALESLDLIGEIFESRDGIEMLKSFKNHSVDLIIVDYMLPKMTGMEAIREIRKTDKLVKIIMFTSHEESSLIEEALKNSVSGFLLKTTESLADFKNVVIQALTTNNTIFGKGVLEILNRKRDLEITSREMEVLKLLCKGKKTTEIAKSLYLSYYTVLNHRKNLMKKTKCTSISDLIELVVVNKIVDFEKMD